MELESPKNSGIGYKISSHQPLFPSFMTRLDRYLLSNFFRIFLIAQISLTGMFVIVHLFSNLDDLTGMVTEQRSMAQVMFEFYGPRTLDFFDRSVGILILMSGVFTLAMMQRRQEMTAIESAGIPRLRLLRPIVFATILLSSLAVVNRECLLPRYRDTLVNTVQMMNNKAASKESNYHKDHVLGLLVSVSDIDPESQTMKRISVQLPIHLSRRFSLLSSPTAQWLSATGEHPSGLLLDRVDQYEEMAGQDDLLVGERPTIYFPASHADWLKHNQCFVATTLNMEELTYGLTMSDYTSLPEMIATLRRPSQWYSQGNRIAVHSRIVRPILDLALLLVALPLVLSVTETNLFMAAMICVGVTGLFSLVIVASQLLGGLSLVRPPALSAWLPVILFLPASVLTTKLMLK